MKDLIINFEVNKIGKNKVNTVDARELWKKLGSKRQFNNWIKYRIEQYDFVENKDYIVNKIVNSVTKRIESIEYKLTLNMAKELGMIEKTKMGKKIREYFIKAEEELQKEKYIRKILEIESKKQRNWLTDTWKERGYTKTHEYIQSTIQMKKVLGVKSKKKDMTNDELDKITLAELTSRLKLKQNKDIIGFRKVNPFCVDTCKKLDKLINEDKNKLE